MSKCPYNIVCRLAQGRVEEGGDRVGEDDGILSAVGQANYAVQNSSQI